MYINVNSLCFSIEKSVWVTEKVGLEQDLKVLKAENEKLKENKAEEIAKAAKIELGKSEADLKCREEKRETEQKFELLRTEKLKLENELVVLKTENGRVETELGNHLKVNMVKWKLPLTKRSK